MKEYFENTVSRDLLGLCVGDKLGEGSGRKVYEWLPDRNLVLKLESNACSFQNTMEWLTWERVEWVIGIGKWFAPCIQISACGTMLLQKRVIPVTLKQLPKKLPVFLGDTKPENYGMLDGKFVCCDYGTNLLMQNGMTKRLRNVKWNV